MNGPSDIERAYLNGRVIDQGGRVLDYIDLLLDGYYQSLPTNLTGIPMSERERGDIAYYDEMAKSLAGNIDLNMPIGKQVL